MLFVVQQIKVIRVGVLGFKIIVAHFTQAFRKSSIELNAAAATAISKDYTVPTTSLQAVLNKKMISFR